MRTLFKKTFILLCCIYALAITSILRADFNYIDDMGRVLSGYKGWSFYSRFTTDFLSGIVHAGNYLSDISPLPQLLAVIIVALSGALIVEILADEGCSPIWGAIAMIPLGLSPYFLQCFSYKYDSPYMALSILFSVLPVFVFSKYKKKYKYIIYVISVIVAMLLVCTTYQAATGIFPMLVIALSLKMWNENELFSDIVKFAALSVVGYLAALLIFRFFIVVPVDFYASTDIVPISDLIPSLIKNFKTYFSVIYLDFRKLWLVVIAAICVLFVLANVLCSKRSKVAALVVSVIALILMLLVSFGAYIALAKPLFDPRGMYGFGAFVAIISVFVVCINKKVFNCSKICCLILGWLFIVFSFNYGNALSQQKEYTDFRITQVISSLNSLDIMTNGEEKIIEISGTIGYAPPVENQPSQYRMLRNLVPVLFSEDRSWGYTMLLNYYGLTDLKQDSSCDLKSQDLPVLVDNQLHTIKGNESEILIILK